LVCFNTIKTGELNQGNKKAFLSLNQKTSSFGDEKGLKLFSPRYHSTSSPRRAKHSFDAITGISRSSLHTGVRLGTTAPERRSAVELEGTSQLTSSPLLQANSAYSSHSSLFDTG